MSEPTKMTAAPEMTREEALKAYRACKTEAERSALYWSTPVLREIYSAATHPKPE